MPRRASERAWPQTGTRDTRVPPRRRGWWEGGSASAVRGRGAGGRGVWQPSPLRRDVAVRGRAGGPGSAFHVAPQSRAFVTRAPRAGPGAQFVSVSRALFWEGGAGVPSCPRGFLSRRSAGVRRVPPGSVLDTRCQPATASPPLRRDLHVVSSARPPAAAGAHQASWSDLVSLEASPAELTDGSPRAIPGGSRSALSPRTEGAIPGDSVWRPLPRPGFRHAPVALALDSLGWEFRCSWHQLLRAA